MSNKPIFEYLITYKQRDVIKTLLGVTVRQAFGAVAVDNVQALNRREAKRLARDILHAGKIYKVVNTGKVGNTDD